MNDIFFVEPDQVPVPPDEVRIRELKATPQSDGRRVSVRIDVTPFQKRPNMELVIQNAKGEKVAGLDVVEAIDNKMDFTVHLREAQTGGTYTARLTVLYSNFEEFEQDENLQADSPSDFFEKTTQEIDTAETTFEI
jgi:hypothetical protein